MTISAPQLVNVLDHGAAGDEVTDDTAALQAAINAAGPGGTVYVGPGVRLRITAPVTISHDQLTITGGGRINTSLTGDSILVSAHDVTLRDLTIRGPGHGAAYQVGTALIKVTGTQANPIHRLTIDGLTIFSAPASAIRAEWTVQAVIRDCRIRNVRYSGIALISATDGLVTGNIISGVHVDGSAPQGYGIQVTDLDNTDASRSRHVTVSNNVVRDNLNWTGIDTHSGQCIVIDANQTINCQNGIAALPGNRTRHYGPEDVVISNNICVRGSAPDSNAGIVFAGTSTSVPITGTLVANRVIGYSEPYRANYLGPNTLRVNNAIA